MILHKTFFRSAFAALTVAALLLACATEPSYVSESRRLIAEGRGEEALALLDKASREDPAAILGSSILRIMTSSSVQMGHLSPPV